MSDDDVETIDEWWWDNYPDTCTEENALIVWALVGLMVSQMRGWR